MTGTDLLASLASAKWGLARRTYGSSHATLIGLLAQWWLEIDARFHTVLDSAPSYGFKNAGWADLLLCREDKPVGVVEVEGTQPIAKVNCIANYFRSTRPELASLEFGLLLLYAYEAKGRGTGRAYLSPETPEIVQVIKELTAGSRQSFIMIAVEKQYERPPHGIRSTSAYCHGVVSGVKAVCFETGEEIARRVLLQTSSTSK